MYRKIMGFLEGGEKINTASPLFYRAHDRSERLIPFWVWTHWRNVAYFNFETNPKLNETFEGNISPDYLIPILSYCRSDHRKRKTLMVFDEVQLYERTGFQLKFFENAPDYHIIVGSLLGCCGQQSEISFPQERSI